MSNNLRIWDALGKTDPKHTKPFKRAGGFSGTAMKPIWTVKRMTEHFGPAGTGWGMDEPKFETVNAGEEILVFCTVGLWYIDRERPEPHSRVYGVGGDKVMGKNKYGAFTNDEAYKSSYTDALSNAMKQIGVGADIHMGQFDDQKYVRDTEREFAEQNTAGASNRALDEARRDIEQQTGNGKSVYQINKEKKALEALAKTALTAISMAQDRAALKEWWITNRDELRDKLPEDGFAAIVASVESKRDDLPALEAA